MAMVRIRAASFFINGQKQGTIEGIEYDYPTGDEPQFGDPGFIGMSDGAGTTTIKASGIIPVAGIGFDVYATQKARVPVTISLGEINGQVHTVEMRFTRINVKSSQKNGALQGEFDLMGGEPDLS